MLPVKLVLRVGWKTRNNRLRGTVEVRFHLQANKRFVVRGECNAYEVTGSLGVPVSRNVSIFSITRKPMSSRASVVAVPT